jgi:DNA-binding response OmpR family regulator
MPLGSPPDRRQLLVVDDEPYIGRIIQLKLERAPYIVELASDVGAARERIISPAPLDLILLDIMLPHGSGLDLLAELRELPHRRATPVFMLTAKGQIADRERAAALGATDFLTKPFSPKKLLARINALFTD